MEFITAGIIASLWFGILTSISPCPMATNVAAISFIGKKAGSVPAVIFSGFSYTVGRALAYIIIALLIVASLLSIPELARGLQKYINIALGPVLIIIGLILLNFIRLNIGRGFGISDKFRDYLLDKGYAGSMLLGFVFALSFCPVSAGLFFGSLIPLAVKFESPFFLPLVYGIGTSLPVIIFSFIIGYSSNMIGKIFKKMSVIENYARKITGVIFILIGLYLSWEYLI